LAGDSFALKIYLVPIDHKQLPEDANLLRQMVLDLIAQLDAEQLRRIKTERLLRQLLEAKSGRKSEQLSTDQLALFAAELKSQGVNLNVGESQTGKSDESDDDPPAPPVGESSKGKSHGRRPLPGHLKHERLVHDLAEAEKHCTVCAEDLRPIGEETSERYEYIPAQMIVIEDVCKKYACSCTVKTATKPSQPIEKSTAGAGLLTQVIVAKYADHSPLHRQVKIFQRSGVDLPVQTLCDWVAQCAALLTPLYERMKSFVLESKVVGTDDTPIRVLDRNLPQTRKGRIWPYVGDQEHRAVVYDYTATRERAGPEKFLEKYRGNLQADAYVAYDAFFTDPARGLVEIGCWAHCRRHFRDALESDRAHMRAVLVMIAQLYKVEKTARRAGLKGEDLRLAREQGSRPVLDSLHQYLLKIQNELLPKSDAGQAVAYALKNWTALTRYCDDGDIPIDNNRTERSIRGFAVGRGNWMFFGSDNGGKTAAILRSFITSCELVKVDPFNWFRDVLRRIADHPVTKLDELFPHNWAAARN
jgi:transposase